MLGWISVGISSNTLVRRETHFLGYCLLHSLCRSPALTADLVQALLTTAARDAVSVTDMLMGGSGSADVWKGNKTMEAIVRARNVINCAGGAADIMANMIGDKSFEIKPRIGDYLLLKKKQVR